MADRSSASGQQIFDIASRLLDSIPPDDPLANRGRELSQRLRRLSCDAKGRQILEAFAGILPTVPAWDPAGELSGKLAVWLQGVLDPNCRRAA